MSKKKTKSYLIEVENEIKNIKKHIPLDRRLQLNFDTLNPAFQSDCIYGQMYGDCNNNEAVQAIRICGSTSKSFTLLSRPISDIEEIPPRTYPYSHSFLELASFSYLEHYIYNSPQDNNNIIDFLKGNTDFLILSK